MVVFDFLFGLQEDWGKKKETSFVVYLVLTTVFQMRN